MTLCTNAIMREVIVGVHVVHRINPHNVHFVYFIFIAFT